MISNYVSLSTYQDEGIVVSRYDDAVTRGQIERLPFQTLFKRPNLFRFEWAEFSSIAHGTRSVIWSNGKEAFTYWEPDTYEKNTDLESAIAGATGISSGAAYTVSHLLMELSGSNLLTLENLSLAGEEEFERVLCYHLKGKHPNGTLFELWIGKSDLLVRKLRKEINLVGYSTTEEEIHRNIRVNGPIAKEVFDFKPPIGLSKPKRSK